jgi:large subunit ribosomal protein L18
MKLPRRRRLERKTDYQKRLALLKSETPRLVIRRTNRYILMQIVESDLAQDKIILSVDSKELLALGWPEQNMGSLKGREAAYLTGLLIAKKAKSKFKSLILDMGMQRNVHKSRIYAALKGAIDGGLEVPCDAKALPSQERIESNSKLSSIFKKVKGAI